MVPSSTKTPLTSTHGVRSTGELGEVTFREHSNRAAHSTVEGIVTLQLPKCPPKPDQCGGKRMSSKQFCPTGSAPLSPKERHHLQNWCLLPGPAATLTKAPGWDSLESLSGRCLVTLCPRMTLSPASAWEIDDSAETHCKADT